MKEEERIHLGTYGFDNYGNLITIEVLYNRDPEAGLSSYAIGTSPCFVLITEPIHWEYDSVMDVLED